MLSMLELIRQHSAVQQWAPIPAAIVLFGLCGCARPHPPPESAASAVSAERRATPAPEPLGENAVVFAPAVLGRGLERCDLLVHFHGAPDVVRREFTAAGLPAALVVVNYPGLSTAYERPLSEPGRFAELLEAARPRLVERGVLRSSGDWGRVWLSSFSAGYGAVRAILAQPESFERVDGIYLADSLYAGYADDAPAAVPATQRAPATPEMTPPRRVNPAHVAPFRRFAAAAVAGRKVLIITHSYLAPGTYAGTHETAADLLGHVGVEPRAVDEGAAARLRIVSRAEAGRLRVYGCAGDTGEDHMAHLRNLRWGLGELFALSRGA